MKGGSRLALLLSLHFLAFQLAFPGPPLELIPASLSQVYFGDRAKDAIAGGVLGGAEPHYYHRKVPGMTGGVAEDPQG